LNGRVFIALCTALSLGGRAMAQDPASMLEIAKHEDRLVISADGKSIATYVFRDPSIPRPYFAHVRAPGGHQVTRNHPPIAGRDRTDHDTMHPGIWMAFGDLGGSDFWRNRASIVHHAFLETPQGGAGTASFVEEKHYLRVSGSLVCKERFRCTIHVLDGGYLLSWDSTFFADDEFYFGDQEEMGLGLRVATQISELEDGRLKDSEDRVSAEKIWSHAAAWCDYSGPRGGDWIGMTLMCHPANFRQSWLHARDYGFVAANPFGQKAMKKGPPSKVVVKPGDNLRLRYAIWMHATRDNQEPDIAAAYAKYLKVASANR
jgi:hypothetical protein